MNENTNTPVQEPMQEQTPQPVQEPVEKVSKAFDPARTVKVGFLLGVGIGAGTAVVSAVYALGSYAYAWWKIKSIKD